MIWCVEDDAIIRDIELYALRSTGFEARGFEDGLSFWQALMHDKPALVVLDVMLPGMDGIELLRKIRASAELRGLPIIMATAKGAEYDKILSLDLGADDYVVKPFGVMELISRIKAVLRRYQPPSAERELRHGSLTMNLDEHTVTIEGSADVSANGSSNGTADVGAERILLTYKEFELLRLFMSHPGIAFTRDAIFAAVWGMDYAGETRTVDMHVRTLRQKLGEHGSCIETVRNVGYRMEKLP